MQKNLQHQQKSNHENQNYQVNSHENIKNSYQMTRPQTAFTNHTKQYTISTIEQDQIITSLPKRINTENIKPIQKLSRLIQPVGKRKLQTDLSPEELLKKVKQIKVQNVKINILVKESKGKIQEYLLKNFYVKHKKNTPTQAEIQPEYSDEEIFSEEEKKTEQEKLQFQADSVDIQYLKRMRYDFTLRNKYLELKIELIENQNIQDYIRLIFEIRNMYQEKNKMMNQQKMMRMISYMTIQVCYTNDCLLLINQLQLNSKICFQLQNFDKCIFFNQQIILISNHSNNTFNLFKSQALAEIAKCCIKLGNYDQSIKFSKKALQYAWYINNQELEIEIYDILGFAYFYLGQSSKSLYYHERALQFDYEDQNSALRGMAIQLLIKFIKSAFIQNNIATDISLRLFNKLNLPINLEVLKNKTSTQQLRDFMENEKFDQSSTVNKIKKSLMKTLKRPSKNQCSNRGQSLADIQVNGDNITEDLLQSNEFEFLVHTPKDTMRQELKKQGKKLDFELKIIHQNTKVNQLLDQYKQTGKIINYEKKQNPLLKVEYENQIKNRLQEQNDLNKTMSKVENKVYINQLVKMNKFTNKITLTHKSWSNIKSNEQNETLFSSKQIQSQLDSFFMTNLNKYLVQQNQMAITFPLFQT